MDETENKNLNKDNVTSAEPTQPITPAIPDRFKQNIRNTAPTPTPDPKKLLIDKDELTPKQKQPTLQEKKDVGISYEVDPTTKELAPEPLTQTPRSVGQLPRIRTYAADMSGAIKQRGETIATIVNKERISRKKPEPSETEAADKTRRLIIISGSLLLIAIGAFAIGGALFFSKKDSTIDAPRQSIIFANQTKEVTLRQNESLDDELAFLRTNENLSLGEVLRIEIIQNNLPITGSDLARTLGLPSTLARDVTNIMVGIHSFDRNQPFIILEVLAYDRAFGALLSSERTLARELGDFYKPTSATSSAPLLTFEDKIIRNLDARVSVGSWPILYTFPERNMLILTTNEYTLQEILTRLQSSLR